MSQVPIQKGQRFALNRLMGQFSDSRDMRLWMINHLLIRHDDITSTSDLTVLEWRRIRDRAYPDWGSDDWTVGDAFVIHMHTLACEYKENVLGQKRLFL